MQTAIFKVFILFPVKQINIYQKFYLALKEQLDNINIPLQSKKRNHFTTNPGDPKWGSARFTDSSDSGIYA
jgi:hypothetical protein